MKFAIQSGYQDRGVSAIASCREYRICKNDVLLEDEVPLGSVEWTEKVLGRVIVPDYYPRRLRHLLHRQTWIADKWPVGRRCFIKPAYRHKAWKARIYNGRGYSGKKRGPYLISEVVRFRNEYRYYVADGKVLSGWWYWGDSQDIEQRHEGSEIPDAPELSEIEWPSDYCGAVDFGELWDSGEMALIETNSPFACGWYGDTPEHYAKFLESGWKYLLKNHGPNNIC